MTTVPILTLNESPLGNYMSLNRPVTIDDMTLLGAHHGVTPSHKVHINLSIQVAGIELLVPAPRQSWGEPKAGMLSYLNMSGTLVKNGPNKDVRVNNAAHACYGDYVLPGTRLYTLDGLHQPTKDDIVEKINAQIVTRIAEYNDVSRRNLLSSLGSAEGRFDQDTSFPEERAKIRELTAHRDHWQERLTKARDELHGKALDAFVEALTEYGVTQVTPEEIKAVKRSSHFFG